MRPLVMAATLLALAPPPGVQAGGLGGLGGFGGTSPPAEPTLVIDKGPLPAPLRIDVNARQKLGTELLVTDHEERAVYAVDSKNPDQVRPLFTIEGRPMALASAGALVFVGNRSLGRLQVYRNSGTLLRTYDTELFPRDMAIDARGRRLAVVDGLSRTVRLFNFKGREVDVIDGFGDLHEPQGVAVERSSRKLVVTDLGDPRLGIGPSLQVYDRSGARLLKIPGDGHFSSPRGVAVSQNRIFMVDALLGQVLVFDLNSGAPLGALGAFGTGPGELFVPSDIAYDEKADRVYVTCRKLGRVIALAAGGGEGGAR